MWFEKQIELEKKHNKKVNQCEHRNKAVSFDNVTCMSCNKILADNIKDAEKYYA